MRPGRSSLSAGIPSVLDGTLTFHSCFHHWAALRTQVTVCSPRLFERTELWLALALTVGVVGAAVKLASEPCPAVTTLVVGVVGAAVKPASEPCPGTAVPPSSQLNVRPGASVIS